MKIKNKKLLWSLAPIGCLSVFGATTSCVLKVDQSVYDAINFGKNNYMVSKKKFEDVNKKATNEQIQFSNEIRNARFLATNDMYTKIIFKVKNVNSKSFARMTKDQAFEVLRYYFKNTPYSFHLYTNLDKIIVNSGVGELAYKNYDTSLPTEDVIYSYIFKHLLTTLKSQNTLVEKYQALMKQLILFGLKLNENQKRGMSAALTQYPLLNNLKDSTQASPTEENSLFKQPVTDPILIKEFLKDPISFLNKHQELLVDIKDKSLKIQQNLQEIRETYVEDAGATAETINRLIANLFYFVGYNNTQIGMAYDKKTQKIIYYLEVYDPKTKRWLFFNPINDIEKIKANQPIANFETKPVEWTFDMPSLDIDQPVNFLQIKNKNFGATTSKKEANYKLFLKAYEYIRADSKLK